MSPCRLFITLVLLTPTVCSLRAVETINSTTGNYYNTTNNISSSVSNWSSGWGTGNTNTGWDYVGQAGQYNLSAVYLGNGWVLTAAHVYPLGTNVFTLNGNAYDVTGTSYTNFTNAQTGTTNADLTLFQISTTSKLGVQIPLSYNLSIATNTPAINKKIVMIGYGGTGAESWATNKVAFTNQLVQVGSWVSKDFVTQPSGTNYGLLVGGDSGGADFATNAFGSWQLVGINEANDTNNNSYMIDLSCYASQINSFVNTVPEPSTWTLIGLGLASIALPLWRKRWYQS